MNDKMIYSFEYSLKNWIALKENKASAFKMTCCGNQAILKTSKLGTQFFAHKAKPKDQNCSTGGETVEHMHIKYLVSKKLFECGWKVEVEKRGESSKGEIWIADIYAEKDKAKIAIEVQWSRQSFIETKRRQQVYKDSGVRGAWLLRSGSAKDRNAIVGDFMYRTKNVPVFSVYKQTDGCYQVYNIHQVSTKEDLGHDPIIPTNLALEEFIEKLVSGQIKFCQKYSPTSQLSLDVVRLACWSCHQYTNIVKKVNFKSQLYGLAYRYSERSQYVDGCSDQIINLINHSFSKLHNFAPLRSRYSKTEGKSYIANSCTHCDALMGRYFIKSWGSYPSNRTVTTEEITIPKNGKILIESGEVVFYNKTPTSEVGSWILTDS